jgi:hypothetical protein
MVNHNSAKLKSISRFYPKLFKVSLNDLFRRRQKVSAALLGTNLLCKNFSRKKKKP